MGQSKKLHLTVHFGVFFFVCIHNPLVGVIFPWNFSPWPNVKIDSLHMMSNSERLAIGTTNHSKQWTTSQSKKLHRTIHFGWQKNIFEIDFSVKLFSLAKELYKDLRENALFPVLKVEESGAIVFSPITKLDEIKVENNWTCENELKMGT